MDWLTFFSKVIDSTIWPTTVVAILIIFKSPFSKVFQSITNLKYKDLSMDFKRDLVELEEATKGDDEVQEEAIEENVDTIPEAKNLRIKTRSREEEIEQVALISPQAAIPLAWTMVEYSILKAVMRLAISPDYPPRNSSLKNLELLRKYASLDNDTSHVLNKMRMMRNEAAHGKYENGSISTNEALEYASLARKMVFRLNKISRK
ncbi:MAG: hypothetical protein KAI43_01110 [Candidatus Aureabacteria bacterium]|nr:hypothetical protein [Candidatus Auribacterota bacterium]